VTELGATEKAPPEEIEALEMAEMLLEPMVLVCCCTDSIESTAFLRATHVCCSARAAACSSLLHASSCLLCAQPLLRIQVIATRA
jgi:hypothetical protein